jgi:ribosomal protein L24E
MRDALETRSATTENREPRRVKWEREERSRGVNEWSTLGKGERGL